ncbi:MAG: glycosyltransferase family 4 protein [Clostridia bacterium]|nr:glycosyltransferase family 4 protein [Clostridia bacterium]
MKIFHINCNYVGTTLHQIMAENLEKMNHRNQIYVPVYSKNVAVIKPNDNVCVSECFKKWDRLVFDYKQNKIYNDIVSKFDVSEYDCIHAYTLFTDGNCARRLSEKYGVPYVVAVRNTDVNTFLQYMPHLRSRGVKTMREASAVFFLSEAYRKQVFDKYVPEKYRDEILKKTYIIPNGIDNHWLENTAQPREINAESKELKLIYAGRIDKNKNIPSTQKAMEILRNEGYKTSLTVVGKIQDKAEFDRIMQDKFTSYIPNQKKEELLKTYRDHDIFVMPSFTESFGLVYAEAMSQGLPVIYSAGQGFDGQFENGEVGRSVDSHNPASIAEEIKNVISDYSAMSKRATEGAQKFNWSEIACRYDEIYKVI